MDWLYLRSVKLQHNGMMRREKNASMFEYLLNKGRIPDTFLIIFVSICRVVVSGGRYCYWQTAAWYEWSGKLETNIQVSALEIKLKNVLTILQNKTLMVMRKRRLNRIVKILVRFSSECQNLKYRLANRCFLIINVIIYLY